MQIDQYRERLRERAAILATLVESAFVTTIACAAEPSFQGGGRLATIHDEITTLAHEVRGEGIEFLVRFRPVATDLQFAITALACCSDLQVAAVAIDGLAGLMDRDHPEIWSGVVPSFDRMTSCVHMAVSLAADAICDWDGNAYEAIRDLHADAAVVRERVRDEVAAAAVRPSASIERLIDADAAACMLDRIVAVAAACVRRLARTAAAEPSVPLVPS